MKIKSHRNTGGNDFYWVGECEHCGHVTDEIKSGYHDGNYHNRVIPSIECKECGKSTTDAFKGQVTVERH